MHDPRSWLGNNNSWLWISNVVKPCQRVKVHQKHIYVDLSIVWAFEYMLIIMLPCFHHNYLHENHENYKSISMSTSFIEGFVVHDHAWQIIMTSYGLNLGHSKVQKSLLGLDGVIKYVHFIPPAIASWPSSCLVARLAR